MACSIKFLLCVRQLFCEAAVECTSVVDDVGQHYCACRIVINSHKLIDEHILDIACTH